MAGNATVHSRAEAIIKFRQRIEIIFLADKNFTFTFMSECMNIINLMADRTPDKFVLRFIRNKSAYHHVVGAMIWIVHRKDKDWIVEKIRW